ncbi:unnamed protein product [Lymnaea stagnalis]|uniref:Uncharacterized protein n=2 Tax=Lymnaea stagnalis TaxID=6523 RepID=A0AAV2HH56_LYMST
MEFLKALDEAKKQGISKEEFVQIWDTEAKLNLQKEESRTLELRLACGTQRDPILPALTSDKIEDLLHKNLKAQQHQIQELKSSILKEHQVQYQEIAKLLETQAALIGQVMRNELERVIQSLHLNSGFSGSSYNHGLHDPHESNGYNGMQRDGAYFAPTFDAAQEYQTNAGHCPQETLQPQKPQKKKKQKVLEKPLSMSCSRLDNMPDSDEVMDFLPADGAEFIIQSVQTSATSGEYRMTPTYYLNDCPCKVRLCFVFGIKGQLIVYFSIAGVSNQPLKAARIFECIGYIKNKNSGAFSHLFEVVSQPLRKLKPNKEIQVLGTVSLKTSGGTFKDVTTQQLEDRGFVINNTMVIKWVTESFEASSNAA